MMNSSFSSNHPGTIHTIRQIVLVQNSQCGKELNQFCPPNSSDVLCLFFCISPSSTGYYIGLLYVDTSLKRSFGLVVMKGGGGGVVKTVVPTVCIFLVKECDLVGGEIEAAHTKLTHLQHKEKNKIYESLLAELGPRHTLFQLRDNDNATT